MIPSDEFDRFCNGQFTSVTLESGPIVQGYAARDLQDFRLMRIDGFTLEDDGRVSQFSLRLEQSQIKAASVLKEPPAVTDLDGTVHRMRSAFWDDEPNIKID